MGKRIRYPKKKNKIEQKVEVKNKNEGQTHFVLDVHNSTIGNSSKIGR